jgi:hypothetical protein
MTPISPRLPLAGLALAALAACGGGAGAPGVTGTYRVRSIQASGQTLMLPTTTVEDQAPSVQKQQDRYLEVTGERVRTYRRERFFGNGSTELPSLAALFYDSTDDVAVTRISGDTIDTGSGTITGVSGGDQVTFTYRSAGVVTRTVTAVREAIDVASASRFDALPATLTASGLQIHLDAGDAASYPGTGDVWHDLSGNANDFDLGAGPGPGPDGKEPSFSDGAFTMGGAFFTKQVNGPFVDGIHQPGARFTLELWVYVEPGPGSYFIAMGTSNNVGVTGFRWFLDGALGGFAVANPLPEIQTPAKRLVSADGWQQIAISVDVPAGRGFTFKNGWKFPRDDPDFAIPAWGSTSAAAPNLLRLGTQTNDGAALWPAGARFAIVRMYDRALGVDELRQDYLADRARFGLGAATSAR